MSEVTDIGADIRTFLGEALTGDEPPHRPLAEGSITRGDTARRRNRVLGGAGGVALAVAAVVGTATVVHGGAARGAASSVQAVGTRFELVTDLNQMDNRYDLARNLPAVLNPLLPHGVSVTWDAKGDDAVSFLREGGFRLDGPTGANGVMFGTRRATASEPLDAPCGSPQQSGCQTKLVPGGVVTVQTVAGGAPHGPSTCQNWYGFMPADHSYDFVMNLQCQGSDGAVQLTLTQFEDLVQKPGFADVVRLADLTKPASAFGKEARVEMDAAIGRTMGAILPTGYSQRLSTTNLQGTLDLVGPSGSVVAGADWQVDDPSVGFAERCAAAKPENGGCVKRTVPGGTFYEGHLDGDTTYAFVPDGPVHREFSAQLQSTEPHPLTADQFLAVVKAPGAEQAIKDLNGLLSK